MRLITWLPTSLAARIVARREQRNPGYIATQEAQLKAEQERHAKRRK